MIYKPNIDDIHGYTRVAFPPKALDGSYEKQFRSKLVKAGLDEMKIEILVRRFMYDMTLQEIAKDLHVVTPRTVLNQIEQAMAHIKQKGIKKL